MDLFLRAIANQSRFLFVLQITAIASVLLSSKLEECLKTVVTVLSVYCCIKYRRMKLEAGENHALTSDSAPVLDVSSSIFYKLRQATLGCERLLLEKIGFNTYVELPYKFFLNYLNVLQIAKHKTLPQVSWNNLNDCMRTVACVRFPPEVLASAAIYRASKSLNISLPEAPVPWWVLFNATLDDIKSVCALIDDLHLNPTPKLIKVTKTESFVPSDIKEFCAVVTNTDAPSQSQPRQQAAPASSSAPKYQQPRGNDGYFRR